MNALVFIGWWWGLSLVAGVGVGRMLGRAAPTTAPAGTRWAEAQGWGPLRTAEQR